MNTKAMYKLSYGLFVLTAKDGEKDNGCIINTAIQAASGPNQMSICINKANFTHDMIVKTGVFNVSVLSQKAPFELFKRFGFQSGRDVNKFEGYTQCQRAQNGIYYVTEGSNAYFSVKVDKTLDLGSHTLFVGEITDMEVLNDIPSVTYEYYLNNIKPKPEAVGVTSEGKTIWRCKICGYEYVGEELPEDFIADANQKQTATSTLVPRLKRTFKQRLQVNHRLATSTPTLLQLPRKQATSRSLPSF